MSSQWRRRAVLITAGPTREHLDPIRFMTNASTGAMGFALARAARRLGARVTVVRGPTSASAPAGVAVVPVVSAREMHRAVLSRWKQADVIIGAAAVGDWRFADASPRKLKRSAKPISLRLVPNADIIADVARRARRDARRRVVVGFALETGRWIERGREKLARKRLDLVVANRPESMGAGRARIALLAAGRRPRALPPMEKARAAREILKAVEEVW